MTTIKDEISPQDIIDKDEVLKMAKQAGAIPIHGKPKDLALVEVEKIEAFAKLVAQAERGACAKVCEEKKTYSMPIPCPDGILGCCVAHYVPGSRMKDAQECAKAIRARGTEA